MNKAGEALTNVRRWLCDNLSDGDAGKACGMLSVVSRHINELEAENAKLRWKLEVLKAYGIDIVDAVAGGYEIYSDDHKEAELLKSENAKLRELVRGLWYCTENESKAMCEGCPLGAVEGNHLALACENLMYELGIEVE